MIKNLRNTTNLQKLNFRKKNMKKGIFTLKIHETCNGIEGCKKDLSYEYLKFKPHFKKLVENFLKIIEFLILKWLIK